MFRLSQPRLAFAATLVTALTLLIFLTPTVGATQQRDRRDATEEETPTPVVLQVAIAEPRVDEADPADPPINAASDDEDLMFVGVPADRTTPPEECPDGFEPAEPPLNPDLGCLPVNASAGSGAGNGGGDGIVAVIAGEQAGSVATNELAVESGTITIDVRWCSNGPNGIDYTTVTLAELMNACQEPGYVVDFTLDLGYWAGSQTVGDVIAGGVYWEPPLGPDPISVQGPVGPQYFHKVYCDSDYDGIAKPNYVESPVAGGAISATLSPATDDLYCAWFLTPYIAGDQEGGSESTVLAVAPGSVEHPGHGCPEGYSYELLLRENRDGSLTWLYGCVPDGSGPPTGPDDIESAGGSAEHPGHGCPDGYSWELLLRENADGSLTWLYGCVPTGGFDPTGPDDVGTGGNGGRPNDPPRIVPVGASYTADPNGAGADGCPDGHHWTDGAIHFPDWLPEPLTIYGGCVPDSGECPDGFAIHPGYTEYGCLRYGTGPWTT